MRSQVCRGSRPVRSQLRSSPSWQRWPPGAPVISAPFSPSGPDTLMPVSVLLGLHRGLGLSGPRGSPDPRHGFIAGILYGTMTMELGGRVTIECEKNSLQAELEFKLKVAQAAQPPQGFGGCGARAGERQGLGGSPTTLSVPRDGFLSRGIR